MFFVQFGNTVTVRLTDQNEHGLSTKKVTINSVDYTSDPNGYIMTDILPYGTYDVTYEEIELGTVTITSTSDT